MTISIYTFTAMKNSVEDLASAIGSVRLSHPLAAQLQSFREFGMETRLVQTQGQLTSGERITVPTFVNEFWTARQRQASSLHEVSYRACFKPQLPRFFIERLTQPGDVVYDPFITLELPPTLPDCTNPKRHRLAKRRGDGGTLTALFQLRYVTAVRQHR